MERATTETQQLYQLELVVRTVTQCGRPRVDDDDDDADGRGVTVDVQLTGHEEQTVCHVPVATEADGGGGGGTDPKVTCVDRGKTYTFVGPTADLGSTCVNARLYMRRQSDRVRIASGELSVPLRARSPRPDAVVPRPAAADEQTVTMTGCPGDLTVAVLTVRARVWPAGQAAAGQAAVGQAEPSQAAACSRLEPPSGVECCARDPPPKAECSAPEPPPSVERHDGRGQKADAANTTCRRGRKMKPATDVRDPHRQFSTIGCEINGRKVDLRVRKKNFETCAVQRKITDTAEAFTAHVLAVGRKMHELVLTTQSHDDEPM